MKKLTKIFYILLLFTNCSLISKVDDKELKCIVSTDNPCLPLGEDYFCYPISGENDIGICIQGKICSITDECSEGSCCQMNDCNEGDECYGVCKPVTNEICDGEDNDCDNLIDEDFDKDLDGFPAINSACSNVSNDRYDCDDNNNKVYPDAPEVCGDGLDNNCNGTIDDGFDMDRDGFKLCVDECRNNAEGCDCNDLNDSIYPGSPEICDGKDNDCDNEVDEDFEGDKDKDGYTSCSIDCPGIDPDRCDCNDNDDEIFPSNPELCDNKDNNCNGDIDEGFDSDKDGYKICIDKCNDLTEGCDCNDNNSSVNPRIEEICDGTDNNCDEIIDNGQDDLCNADERCAGIQGCISNDIGECTNNQECDNGQVCNIDTKTCLETVIFGNSCIHDVQCNESNQLSCISLNFMQQSDQICSRMCSQNSDCNGFSSNGYCLRQNHNPGICIPVDWLDDPLGETSNGTYCYDVSDCTSGLCGIIYNYEESSWVKQCLESCNNDEQCEDDKICTQVINSEANPFDIIMPGNFPNNDEWDSDFAQITGCQTGYHEGQTDIYENTYYCNFYSLEITAGNEYCTVPCCNSSQCDQNGIQGICYTTETEDGYVTNACIKEEDLAIQYHGNIGESCNQNEECSSYKCIDRYCTDTCCGPEDCPQGFVCEPFIIENNNYISVCQRK